MSSKKVNREDVEKASKWIEEETQNSNKYPQRKLNPYLRELIYSLSTKKGHSLDEIKIFLLKEHKINISRTGIWQSITRTHKNLQKKAVKKTRTKKDVQGG